MWVNPSQQLAIRLQRILQVEDTQICLFERSPTAWTQIDLYNASDKPLCYKIKCDRKSNISVRAGESALPAGSGCILPNEVQRCGMTWHRPEDFESWEGVPTPKLRLETHFMSPAVGKKNVLTRLSTIPTCMWGETPVHRPMLEKVGFESERLTAKTATEWFPTGVEPCMLLQP
ncbi:unnamed protein product [Toxocara canis]|uniref:MSP domain-containing protein n=1 Tax=Toxocara canis TaxID=6265 RepID=A0A183U013_TOXCA|nr:unnamed protein product [Toxocara canis]